MTKEFIVKVTDLGWPDGIHRFEEEYAPEQELIRCKDCQYWKDGYLNYVIHPWLPCMEIETKEDWFCACGEKLTRKG